MYHSVERHSSWTRLSLSPRAAVGGIQTPGNPEPRKNPSLITQPVGEQLEALTPLRLGRLDLFPHASFSFFFFFSLTHCRRTNAITFQGDIYNPRHPSDQHFPVTFSPSQLAGEFFLCYALAEIFLRHLWLHPGHSSAATGKGPVCAGGAEHQAHGTAP